MGVSPHPRPSIVLASMKLYDLINAPIVWGERGVLSHCTHCCHRRHHRRRWRVVGSSTSSTGGGPVVGSSWSRERIILLFSRVVSGRVMHHLLLFIYCGRTSLNFSRYHSPSVAVVSGRKYVWLCVAANSPTFAVVCPSFLRTLTGSSGNSASPHKIAR